LGLLRESNGVHGNSPLELRAMTVLKC
jgi:hypothetical protein